MPDAPPSPVLETPPMPGERVAFAVGQTGRGKTAYSRARAALWDRVLFVDTKSRHTGVPDYYGMIARTGRELQDLLRKHVERPAWKIDYTGPVLVPVDPSKPEGPKSAEAFFRAMARIPNYLLVVEEAQNYMTSNTMPDGLRAMALEGRTLGQAITICSQRAALVCRTLTAEAREIVAWAGIEPNDVEALEARGFDGAILDSLKGRQSLRLHAPEGGEKQFYICRCDFPHAGHCGEPIPKPPVKFPGTIEAPK